MLGARGTRDLCQLGCGCSEAREVPGEKRRGETHHPQLVGHGAEASEVDADAAGLLALGEENVALPEEDVPQGVELVKGEGAQFGGGPGAAWSGWWCSGGQRVNAQGNGRGERTRVVYALVGSLEGLLVVEEAPERVVARVGRVLCGPVLARDLEREAVGGRVAFGPVCGGAGGGGRGRREKAGGRGEGGEGARGGGAV